MRWYHIESCRMFSIHSVSCTCSIQQRIDGVDSQRIALHHTNLRCLTCGVGVARPLHCPPVIFAHVLPVRGAVWEETWSPPDESLSLSAISSSSDNFSSFSSMLIREWHNAMVSPDGTSLRHSYLTFESDINSADITDQHFFTLDVCL